MGFRMIVPAVACWPAGGYGLNASSFAPLNESTRQPRRRSRSVLAVRPRHATRPFRESRGERRGSRDPRPRGRGRAGGKSRRAARPHDRDDSARRARLRAREQRAHAVVRGGPRRRAHAGDPRRATSEGRQRRARRAGPRRDRAGARRRPDHRDRGRAVERARRRAMSARRAARLRRARLHARHGDPRRATARSMPCARASSSRRRSPASRRRWISSRSRSTIRIYCDATPREAGALDSAASCAFIRSRSRSRTTHSRPSDDEVAWARAVLDEFASRPGDAVFRTPGRAGRPTGDPTREADHRDGLAAGG